MEPVPSARDRELEEEWAAVEVKAAGWVVWADMLLDQVVPASAQAVE